MKTYPYQEAYKPLFDLYDKAGQKPVCIKKGEQNIYLITDKDIETLYFWKLKQLKNISDAS